VETDVTSQDEPPRADGPVEGPSDEELFAATLRLQARGLALVLGLTCGLGLFVATNWLVLKGGPVDEHGDRLVGPHLSLLGQYFIGYDVSFLGSLIGFAWAFAFGAITGLLVATIYNRLAFSDGGS
jgi:hypothetical protein